MTQNYPRKNHPTKIYVGNLNYRTTESQLAKLFRKYGKVGKIELIKHKETQKNIGIAFLQMYDSEAASKAIHFINGAEIGGRTLKVSIALEREKQPDEIRVKKEKAKREHKSQPRRRKRKFDFNFTGSNT